MRAHRLGEWPNLYVDLDDFVIGYISSEDEQAVFTIDPYQGVGHLGVADDADSFGSPLTVLCQHLLGQMTVAPTVLYNPRRYLYQQMGVTDWYEVRASDDPPMP